MSYEWRANESFEDQNVLDLYINDKYAHAWVWLNTNDGVWSATKYEQAIGGRHLGSGTKQQAQDSLIAYFVKERLDGAT